MALPEMALRPTRTQPRPLADVAARAQASLVASDAASIVVTGVTVDSREVVPGDLFGALPGLVVHGATFGAAAAALGAVAILTDAEGARLLVEAGVELPLLLTEQPRLAIGEAAALVYGDPSHELTFIGVMGTNGKTTTTY